MLFTKKSTQADTEKYYIKNKLTSEKMATIYNQALLEYPLISRSDPFNHSFHALVPSFPSLNSGQKNKDKIIIIKTKEFGKNFFFHFFFSFSK